MQDEELTHQEYQEKYPEEFGSFYGVVGEILWSRPDGHPGVYVVPKATRFEIYSGTEGKRVLTLAPGASIHLQDDGRTVKIFTNESVDRETWFTEAHDWARRRAEFLNAEKPAPAE